MHPAVSSTVLVVEDEAVVAADLQEMLIGLGYTVPITAASGPAGIRAAGEIKPQLILMDIKLRGAMDGVEAARIIHDQMDVPVVFLTSYSDDATLDRAKGAAPAGYLVKPFTDRAVRTAIEVALLRHTVESKLAHRMAISERLASLGTMSAEIVHEINNPMTYIAANGTFAAEIIAEVLADLSAEEGAMSDARRLPEKWARDLGEARKALSELSEGAERVRRIVKSVGRFTRLDGPATRLDLARAIDQAAKMVSSQFPPRTEVVRDFRPTPTVVANEGQLTEVFMNLLVNASQALASSDAASPRITVSTHADGPDWSVAEVSDNGCGIPEAIRARIFEPFFTTKPIGSGTGLGLHICQSIVASLGGEFTVTSTPERGTVFRITLPAAAEEPAPARTSRGEEMGATEP